VIYHFYTLNISALRGEVQPLLIIGSEHFFQIDSFKLKILLGCPPLFVLSEKVMISHRIWDKNLRFKTLGPIALRESTETPPPLQYCFVIQNNRFERCCGAISFKRALEHKILIQMHPLLIVNCPLYYHSWKKYAILNYRK
jgi:hypothetical protein